MIVLCIYSITYKITITNINNALRNFSYSNTWKMTKMIPKCKAKVIIVLFFYINYYCSKFYKPECFPQSKYAVFYWQVISDLEQQVSLLLSWGQSSNTVREAESIKEINHSMNNIVTEIIIRDTVQFRETLDLRQGLLQITALSFISHKPMFRPNLFFNKHRPWILIFSSFLYYQLHAMPFSPLSTSSSQGVPIINTVNIGKKKASKRT